MASSIKYKVKEGSVSASINDQVTPMIRRLMRETLPELEGLVRDKYLEPIYRHAFNEWPIGNYNKERSDRKGGVSKAALAYDVTVSGPVIKGRIYNNARYPDVPGGRYYAYLIYENGNSSTRRVWVKLVQKPFKKAARAFSDEVAVMLRDISGGR